jgi:hypothetical protein
MPKDKNKIKHISIPNADLLVKEGKVVPVFNYLSTMP